MTHDQVRTIEWAPVSSAQYQQWLAPVRARLVRRRDPADSAAEATVDRALGTLLPDGPDTPGEHLLLARVGAEVVGQAWLGLDGRGALVRDLAGEELLPALERYAAGIGADAIKISMFEPDRYPGAPGYRVVNTQMRRALTDADDAGPRRELREMTADQWAAFRANQESDYAAEMLRAGQCATAAEAAARAERELAELLPAGRDTPDQRFLMGYAGGEPVGFLWYCVDPGSAFVLDLLVYEPHRRRGHAAGMLRAMHDRCRTAGLATIGLSVFGFNDGARALYDALGYRPVEQVLVKSLR
ncbi:GNAT family N-acetyltransferase [Actinocatenispora thailandica]|nr:GNAT family N-acetyltransferase [Actinocatenispora thailandica]